MSIKPDQIVDKFTHDLGKLLRKTFVLPLLILGLLLSACASQAAALTSTTAVPQGTQAPIATNAPSKTATVDQVQATSTVDSQPEATSPVENSLQGSASSPGSNKQEELIDILGNLSYSGVLPDQRITLTDGIAYYQDGGSGHPFVRLIDHLMAMGDLNGDAVEDAVAFLVDYSTGSGDFVYLAPVLNAMDEPTPLNALMIGDRSPVKSVTIEGNKVIVEQIASGPDDPACCPSWNTRKVFSLEDSQLVEQSSEPLSKVSLDDLSGTRWKLVNLNLDQEPVLPESEITLQFDGLQISGSAGCNSYTSSVTGGEDLPQTFVVGSIAATKMICPDPVSNQENIYLDRLGKVVAWRYDFGNLALTYKPEEGVFGELLFAPEEDLMSNTNLTKPNSVSELEVSYGALSQAGFGSAVFFEPSKPADDLEKMALEKYRYFVGDLWERYGVDAWMGSWKQVYARQPGVEHNILAELRGIQDPEAAISVSMILENIEGADKARLALASTFDDPRITDLQVFNLGDGGAMSGLLIAGRYGDSGDAIFLVFLMD